MVLPEAHVVYGTYGHLNAAHDNAILLPSHYMAKLNGYGWLIGPGKALDPEETFSGDDGAVWEWEFVLAEQYSGAVSWAAISGHDDSGQRGGGASPADGTFEG